MRDEGVNCERLTAGPIHSLLNPTMKCVKPSCASARFLAHNDVTSCPVPSYSTIYTMFPVFSLVLDKDVKSEVAMLYPELYKDLLKVCDQCPQAVMLEL